MEYSALVQEHFDRPRNVGTLEGPPGRVLRCRAGAIEQGTRIELSLRVVGGMISETGFRAYGCPHTIAAASWLTENLKGAPVAAADEFDPHALAGVLSLPAEKLAVILVLEDALAGCLQQWRAVAESEQEG